ncbi:hypothetical protein CPLU01_07971 [Colletotrichum plurivorum]|uniref:Uncharacterized protein n=1 Tax=Colletotrichum plurivorum TaxID=2175906 RepID=A0A8H6KD02_9PEZI|nr:hypothetical protein CPLU01_07971 [Colletotrichum plurivorum]
MSANTNTATLNAENASSANTSQSPNMNSATSQPGYGSTTGAGVESSIGREANATGIAATHASTGSQTIGGGDAPTTHGGGIGHQIKGAFAQGHGVGEVLRGKFNSAVDTMAGDSEGLAKDKVTTTGGEREFANREFVKKGTSDKAI